MNITRKEFLSLSGSTLLGFSLFNSLYGGTGNKTAASSKGSGVRRYNDYR